MIIPDVNLLLCSVFAKYDEHALAREWWTNALNGTEPIRFVPVVLSGFVRLATNRHVMSAPIDVAVAAAVVQAWWDRPMVEVLTTRKPHLSSMLSLLLQARIAGNLTTDALIAAHALQGRGTVYSNNTDFGRFTGLNWVNPLRG